MKVALATALVTAVISAPAQANFFNGNDLYEHCSRPTDPFLLGFVSGAYDATEAATAGMFKYFLTVGPLIKDTDKVTNAQSFVEASSLVQGYCVPEKVILRQLSDVFCQYLRDTPANRQRPARVLFNQALSKAYPCPSKP